MVADGIVMIETFSDGEWFEIKGVGWVFGTKLPRTMDPADYVGATICINNRDYTVRGVERYALMPPQHKGTPIGLLVDLPEAKEGEGWRLMKR